MERILAIYQACLDSTLKKNILELSSGPNISPTSCHRYAPVVLGAEWQYYDSPHIVGWKNHILFQNEIDRRHKI